MTSTISQVKFAAALQAAGRLFTLAVLETCSYGCVTLRTPSIQETEDATQRRTWTMKSIFIKIVAILAVTGLVLFA